MNDVLNLPPITVPARDYRRLMRTARELAEQGHPLAAPLLQELHRAAVCTADEIPDDRMWPPAELSILSPVGLALLGLRAGYRMPVIGSDGSPEGCVEVEAVGPRVTDAFAPLGS